MKKALSDFISVDCPRCKFVLAIDWARWHVWHVVSALYECPRCGCRFGD